MCLGVLNFTMGKAIKIIAFSILLQNEYPTKDSFLAGRRLHPGESVAAEDENGLSRDRFSP
jgi:hypothetical protein